MYTRGGVERLIFVFSDSLQAGLTLFVGDGEGMITKVAHLATHLPDASFAGIVCVAD